MRENLAAWLCPEINRSQQLPEIVAVGFQEIVELSPQQIMSTDPVRRQAWEQVVRQTLNDNARKQGSEEYVLVRSGQLVGAALMIFVKSGVLSRIKNVEGSVKKVIICPLHITLQMLSSERPGYQEWLETKGPLPSGWIMRVLVCALSRPILQLVSPIMRKGIETTGQ